MDASIRARRDSLRPLKSKLVALDKNYRSVSDSVRNCLETIKKKGASRLADELLAEADALAEQKNEIEIEREKLRIDIAYRENALIDEKLIANSLLRFKDMMNALPIDDRKELVQLIVKRIVVNQFDPNRDETPSRQGVFKTKIRTSWYLVNVELYATDLLAGDSGKAGISSDFNPIGSGGRARTYNLVVNSHPNPISFHLLLFA